MSLSVAVVLVWFLGTDWSGQPEKFTYGVSFSKFHSDELGLDWKETYLTILDDLGARNLRLSAHWPMVEPEKGKFNFQELDFQIQEAEKRNASVVFAVGRRLPGWPECHEPAWVSGMPVAEKQDIILKYIETTVTRYKGAKAIRYWQVENEPFLAFFSKSACGVLDEEFLAEEINLVRKLDPSRKIIVTDSGEFGLWYKAYSHADIFGTSMYLYVWGHQMGAWRYPITPAFFRIKNNLTRILLGDKPVFLIELSAEPWLLQPIVNTSIETQFDRMGIDKFDEMLVFSRKAGFDTIYLWGAEWWYWLKLKGLDSHWNKAKQLF